MGRILRIGTDTVTNYTLQSTSAYDATNPAGTTGTWPNTPAMDEPFTTALPIEIAEQGVLISFARLPFAFTGALVKIRPTYNTSIGEDPFIELWTHNSVSLVWTRQRRIELSNLFVGVESGTRKIMDLTFLPFATEVDKVWITMDPGLTGSPTMKFVGIQLYGECKQTITTPNPPGTIDDDPCLENPFGFDKDGNPCLVPGVDCSKFPEGCAPNAGPTLDVCNPASVDQYKQFLEGIGDGGVALLEFNNWLTVNADAIALSCAGEGPDPPAPPVPPVPPLPKVDLCDPDSRAAFREALGDPALQADFDALVEALTNEGFFTTNCPTPPPDEPPVYVDPVTQSPDEDPDLPAGTDPQFNPKPNPPLDPIPPEISGQDPTTGNPPNNPDVITERNYFVFASATAQANFEAFVGVAFGPEVQGCWARRSSIFYEGLKTIGQTGDNVSLYQANVRTTGLPQGSIVAIRAFFISCDGTLPGSTATNNITDNRAGTPTPQDTVTVVGNFGVAAPLSGTGNGFRCLLHTNVKEPSFKFQYGLVNNKTFPGNIPNTFEGFLFRIWFYPNTPPATTNKPFADATISDDGFIMDL